MRIVCAGEPFYERHKGKPYCVLHFPPAKSHSRFNEAVKKKLDSGDFNFAGVSFPNDLYLESFDFPAAVDFSNCSFKGSVSFYESTFGEKAEFSNTSFHGNVNFSEVTFTAATDFSRSIFEQEVDFSATNFNASVQFSHAVFNELAQFSAGFAGDADFFSTDFAGFAEFTDAEFSAGASFIGASFQSGAEFTNATFDGDVSFNVATFTDSICFGKPDGGREVFGDKAQLSLENARIGAPELVSFHSMRLQPCWFVNVDSRKFIFTNVTWFRIGVKENLSWYGPAHRLLTITYRHLAVNAEENHRYKEASAFRYLAMDVRRFEQTNRLKIPWRKFAFWELTWWYWLASGYGERVFRAFITLAGIWLLFALLFTSVGFARWEPTVANETEAMTAGYDRVGEPLKFRQAFTYSAGVLTLQRPEPKPVTNTAKTLVLLETILGPVQAALLALAIRRKFIR